MEAFIGTNRETWTCVRNPGNENGKAERWILNTKKILECEVLAVNIFSCKRK
jgi:hypothetical protein